MTTDCPRCCDTLYPETHHVMCTDCGAMVECVDNMPRGAFGVVCAICAPAAIREVLRAKLTRLTADNLLGRANR